MEFEKTGIKIDHIGWSDRVGQSFNDAVKSYANKFNKAQDNIADLLEKQVSYESESLVYNSKREYIESLKK